MLTRIYISYNNEDIEIIRKDFVDYFICAESLANQQYSDNIPTIFQIFIDLFIYFKFVI